MRQYNIVNTVHWGRHYAEAVFGDKVRITGDGAQTPLASVDTGRRIYNIHVSLYMFQVFSGVYAVLDKKWKERHHDRLCEILEKVEKECKVDISFVKGAYQFRGTSPESLSNVLKSLTSESDGNRVMLESRPSDVQQNEELLNDEDRGSPAPGTCDGKIVSSNALPIRENATGDKDLRTSSKDDPADNHKTEPESEQVEQTENPPVTTLADHVISELPNASISDASRLEEGDADHAVTEAAHEEHRYDDSCKSLDENTLPQTDSVSPQYVADEKSLQANVNFQATDKNGTETESTSTPKHEQQEVQASNTRLSSQHASDLPDPHTSSHASDASDSRKEIEQESKKELQTGQKDLIYVRNLPDSSADQEQEGSEASQASIPPCESVAASADNESANELQHGTDTSGQKESGLAASASNGHVKEKSKEKLKASVYARSETDSFASS